MEADKSLVSGSMALLVLKLLEDGDKYGYQMTSELRQRSEDVFHLKAGTLYPLLHSLEEKGLVTAYEREAAAGKPRRYYHLTKAGEAALREKETAWHTYADAVGRVHNIIARGQIADVAQLLALFGPRLAPARLRDGLCLRDDGKLDIGVLHAGAHTGRHHAHAAGL